MVDAVDFGSASEERGVGAEEAYGSGAKDGDTVAGLGIRGCEAGPCTRKKSGSYVVINSV